MNPAMIQMLLRKSMTFGAGIIIGAWACLQSPESFKAVFESSVFALVSALVALAVSGKMSIGNVKAQQQATVDDKAQGGRQVGARVYEGT